MKNPIDTIPKNTLSKNLEKLESISGFKKDWNGYNAEPIPKEVLEKTRKILVRLKEKRVPQPFLAPTAAKSIQLEWDNDCFYLEVSVSENKDLEVFLADQIDVNKGFPLTLEGRCFWDGDLNYLIRLINLFYKKEV